jgi:hypothetical protein
VLLLGEGNKREEERRRGEETPADWDWDERKGLFCR